jgi:hypothetical protein
MHEFFVVLVTKAIAGHPDGDLIVAVAHPDFVVVIAAGVSCETAALLVRR